LLHLDVSTSGGAAPERVYTTALAAPRRVCTTGAFAASGRVYTSGVGAAPGRVYTTAFAAPGRVCTTGALKCVPWEIYEILYMEIITEFRKIMSNQATQNSAKFRGILGNFAWNMEVTEVQKQKEFCVDGIPWTPYPQLLHVTRSHLSQT
jgi:hypothetical protein